MKTIQNIAQLYRLICLQCHLWFNITVKCVLYGVEYHPIIGLVFLFCWSIINPTILSIQPHSAIQTNKYWKNNSFHTISWFFFCHCIYFVFCFFQSTVVCTETTWQRQYYCCSNNPTTKQPNNDSFFPIVFILFLQKGLFVC